MIKDKFKDPANDDFGSKELAAIFSNAKDNKKKKNDQNEI